MKWAYEVTVGTISGEVDAPDMHAADVAATEDAQRQAADAIFGGTWTMRQLGEPDAGVVSAEGS